MEMIVVTRQTLDHYVDDLGKPVWRWSSTNPIFDAAGPVAFWSDSSSAYSVSEP